MIGSVEKGDGHISSVNIFSRISSIANLDS